MYLNLGNQLHVACFNSATKYPSIPTYHALGPGEKLVNEVQVLFEPNEQIFLTEKLDGTNTRVAHFREEYNYELRNADFLIGSREEFLHAKGDRLFTKQLGIVKTMYQCAPYLMNTYKVFAAVDEILVLYGEVYGGKTTRSKSYGDEQGFRLFDVARISEGIYNTMDPEYIATWREKGGQTFMDYEDLVRFAQDLGVQTTPLIAIQSSIPTDLEETYYWLKKFFLPEETTYASTTNDKRGPGRPEGLVIRNAKRTKIAKIRFSDYERTLGIKR